MPDVVSERVIDWPGVMSELGPIVARRADEATDEDHFVADNFALLKSAGLVEAGVPVELGGGGALIDELAAILRALARHCGSTALAFSMHTHQVAIAAWRWRHQKVTIVEPLLRRIAKERIVLVTSGGSDWIAGSGKAERVDGGYRITARKTFASGAPAADIFMTSAILEGDCEPPTVLHFGIPMNSPHVSMLDTWHTLGMRGTGSHDLLIDGQVVPDANVTARRKAGEWSPLFEVIATISMPLVYSVYLGVAESARDIALLLAKRKQGVAIPRTCWPHETELTAARLAHDRCWQPFEQCAVCCHCQSSDDRQTTCNTTCDIGDELAMESPEAPDLIGPAWNAGSAISRQRAIRCNVAPSGICWRGRAWVAGRSDFLRGSRLFALESMCKGPNARGRAAPRLLPGYRGPVVLTFSSSARDPLRTLSRASLGLQ
jgi:alkylation response protein AidB-like acyl-CoA dehydrogenase